MEMERRTRGVALIDFIFLAGAVALLAVLLLPYFFGPIISAYLRLDTNAKSHTLK